MYNRDSSKSGSARRHLCELLKSSVNVYTLEVSFLGYTQPSTSNLITYNEDGYFRLGRNVARTLFEYYKVTGIIPANILTAPGISGPPETEKKGGRKSRSRSRSQPRTLKSQKSKTEPEKGKGVLGRASESKPKKKESLEEEKERIERKNSRRSISQEKAVVQLAELTLERKNESTDSSDESTHNDPQPNKQRYEQNRSERVGATWTELEDEQDGDVPKDKSKKSSSRNQPPLRTNSKECPTPGRDPKPKRKSIETRNQIRARTAAYKTFDFSQIHNVQHAFIGKMSPRYKRYSIGATKRSGLTTGRKVGGGGIVGKKSLGGRREPCESKGWHSEPETDAPCLTIIDFNMLIRKGLDGMAGADGAWRGLRTNNKRPLLSLPSPVSGGTGPSNGAVKEGLNSELPPAPFNLPGESRRRGSKAERRLSCYGRRLPRNKYVRRSRALLLRGTVTDCSPWEDSEGSSDSSDSCHSHSSPTHQPLNYQSSQRGAAHQSPNIKSTHRTPSPLSHILLTI
ncbi:unnamed protein product [Allacma fusca]|uniref:Uncharacterized protein n=1 Tax=Allacma fusca TaxID=39272 RepID=A0A8J2J1N0_9HEXA|nr:unnamed protein product [Allacma fusca]